MSESIKNVKIDDVEYDVNCLSNESKTFINNIIAADAELKRLQQSAGFIQTARVTYMAALKADIAKNNK